MLTAGLDLGSVNTKMVVLDKGTQLWQRVIPSRFDSVAAGHRLLAEFSAECEQTPEQIVVTGYGRISFPLGRVVTEITCQAKGCHYYYPEHSLILDVGGQDAKVIKKNAMGKVTQFIMNDKCAAGTGRFLDVILKAMELSPQELIVAADIRPAKINSMCTVFAESEVIARLAKWTSKPQVVAGLFHSVAMRLAGVVAA
ncbi:MAG: acyl-CoA dehydratase activase, partial [Peptococcaceae bacterium]|nr:acyl-CoA dehydratase activase [Peptococcaceae bacterium]